MPKLGRVGPQCAGRGDAKGSINQVKDLAVVCRQPSDYFSMNIPRTVSKGPCGVQFPLDGFEEVLLARSPKRSSRVCAELSYLPTLTNPHPLGALTLRWVQREAWGDSGALRFDSLEGEQDLEACVPVSLNCTYKCTRACLSWGDGAVG